MVYNSSFSYGRAYKIEAKVFSYPPILCYPCCQLFKQGNSLEGYLMMPVGLRSRKFISSDPPVGNGYKMLWKEGQQFTNTH